MVSSDCHKLGLLFSTGEEEMFCIIEILHSREVEFKIHFKVTCTQSIQSPLLKMMPFQNKHAKVISVLITTLSLTIIKALQYRDSPAYDDSVSHMHQSLLFKVWKL